MDDKNSKEDVYEFKSSKEATPVRGNSTSPGADGKNNSDSKSDKTGDVSGGNETDSVATKRPLSEVSNNDDVEDDNKKKKRKEKESDGKEVGGSTKPLGSSGRVQTVRNVSNNSEKGSKAGVHVMGKNGGGNASKGVLNSPSSNVNSDRKSPSSPKPGTVVSSNNGPGGVGVKVEDSEDGKASSDGEKMDQGPKVPPLKIVIPQQTANEPEQGNRNGKNSTSRHHQALPYVVSTNNSDGEKDGQRSRSASPSDSFKSEEKKDPAIGMLSAEDQKNSLHHQRVLRSSHRSGPGGSGDSRTQESTARNNNGNGQGSTSNSGPSATATNNSNVSNRLDNIVKKKKRNVFLRRCVIKKKKNYLRF